MHCKKILAVLAALTISLLAASCGSTAGNSGESSVTESSVSESSSAETSQTAALPTEDRSGNPITVPENVETIISMAPSITQTLCDLGLQDKLIAVDTNSVSYFGLDELTAFDMMTPDTEQLIALKPDIVFTSGMSSVGGTDPYKPLRDVGICVANIPSSSSIDTLKEDVLFTAKCVGKEAEGQALIDNMEAEMDKIAAIGETITEKKTVLFEIAAAPEIYSFGQGTFLEEMLEMIGAENVFANEEGYISVTEEAAVSANPDVILTNVIYLDDPVGEIMSRSGWENVTAIQNGDVYALDNNASSLPNVHVVDALKQMAKAVYPEQYADVEDPFQAE